MYNTNKLNNCEFIKLDEINIMPDIKVVLIYARFIKETGFVRTIETHSHSFYELHFALSGSCSLCLKNTCEKTLNAGEFLLINPNTNHKFSSFSPDFFRLSVVFDIFRNGQKLADPDKYTLAVCSEKIRGFLDIIISEYKNMELGYSNIVNFHICSAMVELLRENPHSFSTYETGRRMRNVFNEAISFIRNNISANITAEDVAKSVSLSIRQLNRIFNSNINMTVAEFIRNERISRVCDHLKKTNLPLKEIAALTGFNDVYILCKTFKKLTGITPGQYRPNHTKKGLENDYEKLD